MKSCIATQILVRVFVDHLLSLDLDSRASAITVLEEIVNADPSEIPEMVESLVEIIMDESPSGRTE